MEKECFYCEGRKGKICGHCNNSPNCPVCGLYEGKTRLHNCNEILNGE